MKRFIAGADRQESTLFPGHPDDWIDEDNPVRVIDAFADAQVGWYGLLAWDPTSVAPSFFL
jgi:hypothetical protein